MAKFKSRKFWMAVVGGLLVIANEGLDLKIPSDAVMELAAIIIGYLFAEAYVDAKKC